VRSIFACSITVEKNVTEQRCLNWITFLNLNLWFNKWEEVLVDLGFGRKKRSNEEYEVSIIFFDGQKDTIIHLDETDGSLDNKKGREGGNRALYFIQTM